MDTKRKGGSGEHPAVRQFDAAMATCAEQIDQERAALHGEMDDSVRAHQAESERPSSPP